MEAIDQPGVEHAPGWRELVFPSSVLGDDNIRFDYDLAGGATLDLGTYTLTALSVFGAEPEVCLEVDLENMPPPRERCDVNFRAKFRFPGVVSGRWRGA